MKLPVCVFIVFVVATTVTCDDDCRAYFKHLSAEYHKCLSIKIDIAQVFAKLGKVAYGNATVEEYLNTVSSFCSSFNKVPECFDSMVIDKSPCYYDPPIQDFRNALKSFIILNKYGCANNAKRYLEIIEGDGPKCYSQNKESDECFINLKKKHGIDNKQAYQDNMICKIKKADAECLGTYDSCSNTHLKEFLAEINVAVQKQFNCT